MSSSAPRPVLRRVVIVATLALVAGCTTMRAHDENKPASSDVTSGAVVEARGGSRLRAYYVKQGDALLPTNVYRDATLDEDCTFVSTEAGFRCLPQRNAFELFFDAACTEMGIGLYGDAAPEGKYASVYKESTCGYRSIAFEIGDSRAGQPVFVRTGGSCVALPNPTSELHSAKPVAATEFVHAVLDRVAAGPDVEVGRLRGEDGSIAAVGFFDKRRDAPCYPSTSGRCLPSQTASVMHFADSSCTEPAAFWSTTYGWLGTCTPAAIMSTEDICNPQYFEVGEAIPQQYAKVGASCSAQPQNLSHRHFRFGAPIPTSSFPAVGTRRKQVPGATIQETISATGAVLATQLMNTAFDRPCAPRHSSDGTLRCVPYADAHFQSQYSDASCTTPVVATSARACATGMPRPVLVEKTSDKTLYETATTKRNGPIYTRYGDGSCRPTGTSDFYDLLPASAAKFAELTMHQEACHVEIGNCSEACTSDESCGGGFCASSVCIAKRDNGDAIPKDLAEGCTPTNGRRACKSGVCAADGKCGVLIGDACESTTECRSGQCIDAKCVARSTSGDGTESSGSTENAKTSDSSESSAPTPGDTAGTDTPVGETTSEESDGRSASRCSTTTPRPAPSLAGALVASSMLALALGRRRRRRTSRPCSCCRTSCRRSRRPGTFEH